MQPNYADYYQEQMRGHDKFKARVLGLDMLYKGENAGGIEIKHDKKASKRGNLWIEEAEKSNPNRPGPHVPAGIRRDDNTWLIGQGNDELGVFWFLKTALCAISPYTTNSGFETVTTPTSVAWLLPLSEAHRYCIQHQPLVR